MTTTQETVITDPTENKLVGLLADLKASEIMQFGQEDHISEQSILIPHKLNF